MQNLNSSNAKSRKLFYYLQYIPQVLFLPRIISRLSLKKILKNNNSKHKYIESRVKYYLKKTGNFEVSKNSKNSSELLWKQISKNKNPSNNKMTVKFSYLFAYGKYLKTVLTFSKILMNSLY